MEFDFEVSRFLQNEINLLDSKFRFTKSVNNSGDMRAHMNTILDKMGEASAKAQGLHGPITSANKLALSNHRLYMMRDTQNRNSVIGFIKVGEKKLFIYDLRGNQHEMEPLCVLDFYVHESKQRMGCGKKLYEFMLKAEQTKPEKLAIDRPSHKFMSFLQKHYSLCHVIPQVNNFVLFIQFFKDFDSGKPPSARYQRSYYSSHTANNQIGRNVNNITNNYYNTVTETKSKYTDSNNIRHRPSSLPPLSRPVSAAKPQTITKAMEKPIEESKHLNLAQNSSNGTYNPPKLRRDGPSRDYNDFTSKCRQNTIGSAPVIGHNVRDNSIVKTNINQKDNTLGTGWNIFGVPGHNYSSSNPNRYKTRLW